MGSDSATIRLRFDTSTAKSDLDGLDRRVDASARAAQRSLGGGGFGGGILGRALGAGGIGGIGQMGTLAAAAGVLFGPAAIDIARIAAPAITAPGNWLSQAVGLRGAALQAGAAGQAQQDTIGALGPAAAHMSEDQISNIFKSFLHLRAAEARGVEAVQRGTNFMVGAAGTYELLSRMLEALQSISTKLGTGNVPQLPGYGR